MKTILTLGLLLVAFAPAQAQIFRPRAADGLVLGAAAGAIIGNNSESLGHNAWRGAAYGAGVGLLVGSMADANDYHRWGGTQVPMPVYPRGAYIYREPAVVYGNYDYG